MKLSFLIVFFFLVSCSVSFDKAERIYICGDHPCANNKEVQEYFNNNVKELLINIARRKHVIRYIVNYYK